MNLRDWIDKHPREKRRQVRERLAKHLDFSEPYIRHMANGTRPIPPTAVLAISNFTKGEVSPNEMRPDIYPVAA